MMICHCCQTTFDEASECCPGCGLSQQIETSAGCGESLSRSAVESPLGDYSTLERKVEGARLWKDDLAQWARGGAIVGGVAWLIFAIIGCVVTALNEQQRPTQILAFAAFALVGGALATVVGGALGITVVHAIDAFRQLHDYFFPGGKRSASEEGATPDSYSPPGQQSPAVTHHPEP
jgi:hypothetical protein